MPIFVQAYAGTCANGSGFGSFWMSPENAELAPDTATASTNPGSGSASTGLACTNYGFAIPTDATIMWIGVQIRRSGNGTSRFPSAC